MGKRRNNTLKRRGPCIDAKPVIWVSTEGNTEKDYLAQAVFRSDAFSIRYPKDKHPSRHDPKSVLKRVKKELEEVDLRDNDEVWVLIDRDTWEMGDIKDVMEWAKGDKRFHVAVSNPKFELFLVMHFEPGNGCTVANAVDARLKKYMPNYDKRLTLTAFSSEKIETAIENARKKRAACKEDLPAPGMTDVHLLIESLLKR